MMHKATKTTGAALLTALLITALTASIAMLLAYRQRLDIRQAELITTADKAYLNAQGVVDWAIGTLTKNRAQKSKIPVIEKYITKMPTTKFYGAVVAGEFVDQQALFNINCLENANNQYRFIKLLRTVDKNIDARAAQALAQNITFWLGNKKNASADAYYLSRKPPYRAAHRLMVNVSELRLVRGVSAKIYRTLKPYITALPINKYKINVNTAPVPVLITLTSKITLGQAEVIKDCRDQLRGFKSMDQFEACIKKIKLDLKTKNEQNRTTTTNPILLRSHYFLAIALVKIGDQHLSLYSLLQRVSDKKQAKVDIIWQSL